MDGFFLFPDGFPVLDFPSSQNLSEMSSVHGNWDPASHNDVKNTFDSCTIAGKIIFLNVWGKEKIELYSILRKVKNRGNVSFNFYFVLLHLTTATQSAVRFLSDFISTAFIHAFDLH